VKTASESEVEFLATERLLRIGRTWYGMDFFRVFEDPDPDCLYRIERSDGDAMPAVSIRAVHVLKTRLRGERKL
jgi:hypothetical protein